MASENTSGHRKLVFSWGTVRKGALSRKKLDEIFHWMHFLYVLIEPVNLKYHNLSEFFWPFWSLSPRYMGNFLPLIWSKRGGCISELLKLNIPCLSKECTSKTALVGGNQKTATPSAVCKNKTITRPQPCPLWPKSGFPMIQMRRSTGNVSIC